MSVVRNLSLDVYLSLNVQHIRSLNVSNVFGFHVCVHGWSPFFCPHTWKEMLFLLRYVGWGGGGLGLNDYVYKKWLDNTPQIWRFIKENAANQSHVFNYLVL